MQWETLVGEQNPLSSMADGQIITWGLRAGAGPRPNGWVKNCLIER